MWTRVTDVIMYEYVYCIYSAVIICTALIQQQIYLELYELVPVLVHHYRN